MNKKIAFIIVLMLSLGLQAQEEVLKLSLQDAIDRALDSSYVTLNTRREQAKALKQKWETTADGLPQISGGVDYQYNPKLRITPLPAEVVLEPGTYVPGTFVPVVFGTEQNMTLTATLNQLIFDGSYIVALKAAKTFLEYSNNANEKARLEIRQSVISSYSNALLVERTYDVFRNNETTIKDNLEETQKTYEQGLTELEDVEQLQITYKQLQNQVRNTERSLELSKQTLNMVLGLPVNTPLELTDNIEALAINQLADFNLLEAQLDPTQNVDYKIANNFVEQRELEYQLERSKSLPTLKAFANYGTSTFGQEFLFLDSSTPWFQFSTIGVNLSVPIFSSLKRSKRSQRAEIALMQAKTDFTQSLEQIKLDFSKAKSDYRFALESYQLSNENLDLAERIEQKNQIKYKEGISTSFELRQAQVQLYNAQVAYLESMLNLINSKSSLETILSLPDVN